jgi:hypothetical protein
MGDNNIPVPAESLRRLAEGSAAEVRDARQRGHKATAKALQNDIATALEATAGKDGEFVSVPAGTVSSLTAEGLNTDSEPPEAMRHSEAARVYLEQYGVW